MRAWITSGDRSQLLAPGDTAVFSPSRFSEPVYAGSRFAAPSYAPDPSGALLVDVDPHQQFQRIEGYGVALSDASAWLLTHELPEAPRAALLRELFGPQSVLKLKLLRVSVGASEFSRDPYSFDDLPAGQSDPGLANFSIAAQRAELLPLLKSLQTLQPELQLMAAVWSAPAWMKTASADAPASLNGGKLRADAYDAYARYLKRYLDVYRDEGLPVAALSLQNEPGRAVAGYPAMAWETAERAAFIGQHLGPLLTRFNPKTRIIDGEHNWDDGAAALALLADSGAAPYVSGISWHCYAGTVDVQGRVHAAFPAKDSWVSECSGGQWAPEWRDGLLHFSRTVLVGASRQWAGGVMLGNLVLDQDGGPHGGGCRDCRGLLTLDRASGTLTREVEYYALAQLSGFVRPGARRIASDSRRAGVDHVAFVNPDGEVVLLVVNPDDLPQTVTVRSGGQAFAYPLPPASVATLVWKAAAATP